jgi:hypothetical protein
MSVVVWIFVTAPPADDGTDKAVAASLLGNSATTMTSYSPKQK